MKTTTGDWRDFLDEHGAALLLFARQHCTSLADAEDALQEGFVRFWQSRQRVNEPLAYLYSCVRTAALDQHRAAERRHRREFLVAQTEPAWFSATVNEIDRGEAIELALSGLPLEQREALVMRTWGGATFAQIGEALGVSSKTAAARYGEAIESLSRSLAEDFVL